MPEALYSLRGDKLLLNIKVRPNAQTNRIMGQANGELIIKIKAQAEKGKANKELVAFLAKLLGVGKRDLAILRGAASRHKLIACPAQCEPALRSLL